MFDEEPDGDPHGECAAEIQRLAAQVEALTTENANILRASLYSADLATQAMEDVKTLMAGCEALKVDAARYRWLRSGAYTFGVARTILNDTPHGIDAAIDKAMKEPK